MIATRDRLASLCLSLLLMVSIISSMTMPTKAETGAATGSAGSGVTWNYDNGVLIFSGSGSIVSSPSYRQYANSTVKIIIEEGVDLGTQSDMGSRFNGFSSVKEVILPETITAIYYSEFRGCKSLETINIPSGVRAIYGGAFEECINLKEVNIQQGVKKIYDSAFNNCSSLVHVNIPKSVAYIQDNAFDGCSSDLVFDTPSVSAAYDFARYNDIPIVHTFGGWETITVATETEDGLKERVCTTCGEKESEVIPKSGHSSYADEDLAALDERITAAETRLAELESRLAVVEEKKEQLEKDNATLKQELASSEMEVSAVKARVASAETNSVPGDTAITKVSSAKKAFSVEWYIPATRVDGYEIQYSTKKNFSTGIKTANVGSGSITTKKVKKLKAKKKYYVRIRSYKVLSGRKYYTDWSPAKKVKTK